MQNKTKQTHLLDDILGVSGCWSKEEEQNLLQESLKEEEGMCNEMKPKFRLWDNCGRDFPLSTTLVSSFILLLVFAEVNPLYIIEDQCLQLR